MRPAVGRQNTRKKYAAKHESGAVTGEPGRLEKGLWSNRKTELRTLTKPVANTRKREDTDMVTQKAEATMGNCGGLLTQDRKS